MDQKKFEDIPGALYSPIKIEEIIFCFLDSAINHDQLLMNLRCSGSLNYSKDVRDFWYPLVDVRGIPISFRVTKLTAVKDDRVFVINNF